MIYLWRRGDDLTEQLKRNDSNLVTEKNSGDGTIPMGGDYVTMTSVGTKIEQGPSIGVDSYGFPDDRTCMQPTPGASTMLPLGILAEHGRTCICAPYLQGNEPG